MTISLYDALVPSWCQIIGSTRALVDKAEAYCAEKGCTADEIIAARITDDMLPFNWQVRWVAAHSIGAIEGVRAGRFSPDRTDPPGDYAGLRAVLDDAAARLKEVTAEEMEGFIGRDVHFVVPAMDLDIPFTAENFLLSFSQPNFYFHATTAYDIMRGKGVVIGKRDFLGAMRIKAPA